MICFRIIILLFCFSAVAADMVRPLGESVINNGEIYLAEIVSDKSDQELEGFKGKRINSVMYVMDFLRKNDKRLFEIFVTDPPQQQKKMDKPPAFLPSGFKYEYVKKNTNSDIEILPVEFEIPETEINWSPYIALMVLFLLGSILFIFRKRIRDFWTLKKLKQRKTKELVKLLNQAQYRDQFELIAEQKRYFIDLFHVDESMSEMFKAIESIQYKKEWSSEDIQKVIKNKDNIINLRPKSGI